MVTEASAVLNGKFIDGVASGGNPEVQLETFFGVLVHEFGHYVNLDHSQINLLEAFDGQPLNDDAIATMFPFVVSGPETRDPHARRRGVAVDALPRRRLRRATGAITGTIRRGDTNAPFTGAFVIARNVDDPRRDAVGYVSGTRFVAGSTAPAAAALAGAYELPGLTPDATYTVEVEAVSPLFTGGSSVGPLSPPATLPGPAEFWSGDAEAGTSPPDDPDAPGVPIPIAAGAVTTAVDVVLNVTPPPPNDLCAAATNVTAFPFSTTIETRLATNAPTTRRRAASSPPTRKRRKSVWFRLIAPLAGAVTISTAGSSYDTVVSAFTGACGALAGVGCNDDGGSDLTATLTIPVAAGTPYLVEVTDFASTGGTLVLTATFDLVAARRVSERRARRVRARHRRPAHRLRHRMAGAAGASLLSTRPGSRNLPSYRVVCADGDPRCDFDGIVGKNGSCLFHVAICANNSDPRAATRRCVPSAVAEYRLLSPNSRKPRDLVDAVNAATLLQAVASLGLPPAPAVADGRVAFAPALTTLDRCTTFQRVVVPVGTRVLRSQALTPTKKTDSDQLRLRCNK